MYNQPSWHCIANLGDADPYLYGGAFVMVDRRGIYDPELWAWETDDDESDKPAGRLYRVCLERCHQITRYDDLRVGSNIYHPDSPEWFGDAKSLESAASSHGIKPAELALLLCSNSPLVRAQGYIILAGNWGWHEFDHYPQEMTAAEGKRYCAKLLRSIEKANKLPEGF